MSNRRTRLHRSTTGSSIDRDKEQQPQKQQSGLTWITTTNPHQMRDQDTRRNVRVQVMNDYLTKERRNPNSTDVRVRHSVSRAGHSAPVAMTPEANNRSATPLLRRRPSPRLRDSLVNSVTDFSLLSSSIATCEHLEERECLDELDLADASRYMDLHVQLGGIGAKIGAFNTTPTFDGTAELDVVLLKHSCMSKKTILSLPFYSHYLLCLFQKSTDSNVVHRHSKLWQSSNVQGMGTHALCRPRRIPKHVMPLLGLSRHNVH
jgi:hypothetical protein